MRVDHSPDQWPWHSRAGVRLPASVSRPLAVRVAIPTVFVNLRRDRRGSVVHARGDADHPERLAVETLFQVGQTDDVAWLKTHRPNTGFEIHIGIPLDRSIQIELQNARRLIVVRDSQNRKGPGDLLPSLSHVVHIHQR